MQIIRLNNKLKELVWRFTCVHLAVKMATEICAPVRFSKKDESKQGQSRKHFTLNKNVKRETAINTREKIIRNSFCLNSFNGVSPLLDAFFFFFFSYHYF